MGNVPTVQQIDRVTETCKRCATGIKLLVDRMFDGIEILRNHESVEPQIIDAIVEAVQRTDIELQDACREAKSTIEVFPGDVLSWFDRARFHFGVPITIEFHEETYSNFHEVMAFESWRLSDWPKVLGQPQFSMDVIEVLAGDSDFLFGKLDRGMIREFFPNVCHESAMAIEYIATENPKAEIWHKPTETRPSEFTFGPVEGTKSELGSDVANTQASSRQALARALDEYLGKHSDLCWAVKFSAQRRVIWFSDERKLRSVEAKQRERCAKGARPT